MRSLTFCIISPLAANRLQGWWHISHLMLRCHFSTFLCPPPPTPHMHLSSFVCVCAYSVSVLRGRAALAACRLQHVRFPVLFFVNCSSVYAPPSARRASLLRSRLASVDPHSFLVICSGNRKRTREKLIRIGDGSNIDALSINN